MQGKDRGIMSRDLTNLYTFSWKAFHHKCDNSVTFAQHHLFKMHTKNVALVGTWRHFAFISLSTIKLNVAKTLPLTAVAVCHHCRGLYLPKGV